jgi:two-component system response regulator PilR (NtrC family)
MAEVEGIMPARILLVDDERNLIYFLRQTLQLDFAGVIVDEAYSGEEGLSRMANAAYDLLIADIRMPGFSGLELVKGVRYLDPDVPIIVITGYGTPALRKEAMQLGVDAYLDKPFNVADLMAAVGRCLGGKIKANA